MDPTPPDESTAVAVYVLRVWPARPFGFRALLHRAGSDERLFFLHSQALIEHLKSLAPEPGDAASQPGDESRPG
jgi:hypothetical protein